MINIELVRLEECYAEQLFEWRNSPAALGIMGSEFVATFEEHIAWCRTAVSDVNARHLIVLINSIPSAYCSVTMLDTNYPLGGFVSGGYDTKVGTLLILRAFYRYCRRNISAECLYGYISKKNTAMYQINKAMGWHDFSGDGLMNILRAKGINTVDFNLIRLDIRNG